MKIGICTILALWQLCFLASAQSEWKTSKQYFLDTCGPLSPKDHPDVQRAFNVFEKVLTVADKAGKHDPQLVIVKEKPFSCEGSLARALPDGSVLILEPLLNLVYQDVPASVGDARMAFILGHELSHLARDDYWHTAAYYALKTFGPQKENQKKVLKYLLNCCSGFASHSEQSSEFAQNVIKSKELRADSDGILFMTMAGFDPHVILEFGGEGFFDYYSTQTNSSFAYSASHPDPNTRADFLKSQFKSVGAKLGLFHFGMRSYQLGNYEKSILFLEKFLQWFPSQEVFNNLGLSHYQKAMGVLTGCGRNPAMAFDLPTILEENTRGRRLVGKQDKDCINLEKGMKSLSRANVYLKKAVDMAPHRIQTRINFSSSLIRAGNYSAALGVLQPALANEPDNPMALNNKAVALYLYGEQENIETFKQAQSILKELNRKHSLSFAKFNESHFQKNPRENLRLLESIPSDTDHDRSVSRSSMHSTTKSIMPGGQTTAFFTPPIPLGIESGSSSKKLNLVNPWQNFMLGKFKGGIHYSDSIKALVSMDSKYMRTLEIIEIPVKDSFSKEQLLRIKGLPSRVVQGALVTTFVYADFAVDFKSDEAITMLYYNRRFLKN
ncbi:MAG: M48 family metalloprotease [SAR324 cluster bacterium]|nr:M48 family metalloprotease [SAR324 cluster bacterium]